MAKGATRYVLMTCVAGTVTCHTGTIDKLDEEFAALSSRFGIKMEPLGQADVDGLVDGASNAIKWSYQKM